jgi:hypothetical protein
MRRPREGEDEQVAGQEPLLSESRHNFFKDRSVFAEFWVHWAETVCWQRSLVSAQSSILVSFVFRGNGIHHLISHLEFEIFIKKKRFCCKSHTPTVFCYKKHSNLYMFNQFNSFLFFFIFWSNETNRCYSILSV